MEMSGLAVKRIVVANWLTGDTFANCLAIAACKDRPELVQAGFAVKEQAAVVNSIIEDDCGRQGINVELFS